MEQKPSWWEWVDTDRHWSEDIRLLENAPEEAINAFEEWKKRKEEERAKGIWK